MASASILATGSQNLWNSGASGQATGGLRLLHDGFEIAVLHHRRHDPW
jgi:hypothetical protein